MVSLGEITWGAGVRHKGAVLRIGLSKASWEKGLEQVEDKSKKASVRKQHLWWKLIVAYALVKLLKAEE